MRAVAIPLLILSTAACDPVATRDYTGEALFELYCDLRDGDGGLVLAENLREYPTLTWFAVDRDPAPVIEVVYAAQYGALSGSPRDPSEPDAGFRFDIVGPPLEEDFDADLGNEFLPFEPVPITTTSPEAVGLVLVLNDGAALGFGAELVDDEDVFGAATTHAVIHNPGGGRLDELGYPGGLYIVAAPPGAADEVDPNPLLVEIVYSGRDTVDVAALVDSFLLPRED